MERTLDWAPRFDERSTIYRVSVGVDYSSKYVYRKPPKQVLDQGQEGACVGHGWAHGLAGNPHKTKIRDLQTFAFGVYNFAKYIDEWEGENYEGTSVLAGAKVAKDLGLITYYNWCFSSHDIITALHEVGPVVIGVPWYYGMYETDERGYVDVSGEMVGGHCLTIYAYNPKKYNYETRSKEPYFYWRNSWGPEYGKKGTGYIHKDQLETLIKQGAELCVPRTT